MKDVQQTARTALNEVRKIVSQMRGVRLKEEIIHIKQLLQAAEIMLVSNEEEFTLSNVSPFIENILSMCLKEAVTNVVKHSKAFTCRIAIQQSWNEICITVQDDGIGIKEERDLAKGNGLIGIKERLEFVNGSLDIYSEKGTTLIMKIPNVVKQTVKEGLKS